MYEFISSMVCPDMSYNHCIYRDVHGIPFKPHIHQGWEIIYLIRGDASYVVHDSVHTMKRQKLYMVAPGTTHYVQLDSGSLYDRYDLLPANGLLPDSLKKMIANSPFLTITATPKMEHIFKQMDEYYTMFEGEDLEAVYQCLTVELLYNMQDRLVQKDRAAARSPMIQKALQYIDENLLHIDNMEELCNALFVSKSYFHHVFSEALHSSPMEYIRRKRLLLARDALRAGAKATNIYAQFGFSDYSSFYRCYRSFFGISPSEEKRFFELS